MKPKHLSPVIDQIVQTIQEDDCVLERLYLPDCRLKNEVHPIMNALGSNQCLTSLDIRYIHEKFIIKGFQQKSTLIPFFNSCSVSIIH